MYSKKRSPDALNRELEGYKWFGVEARIEGDSILMPYFEGKTFPQHNGITGNEQYIEEVVKFYVKKWKENKFAIHGDLCLCNTIFPYDKNTIHIIDWEHFHYADPKYFGFDIVNMLFIHLHYEYRWLHRLGINWVSFMKTEHRAFVRRMLKLLGGMPMLPFYDAKCYINKYMDKKRFLLARLKPEYIESLDLIWQ